MLLVTSANDDVVDPASSDVVAAALGGDVQRLRLRHSGHVATLDSERHLLQQAIVDSSKLDRMNVVALDMLSMFERQSSVGRRNWVSGSRGSRPRRGR